MDAPDLRAEKIAEHIAHATDGMSQSVEAMHRIEEILEHYAVAIRADDRRKVGEELLSRSRFDHRIGCYWVNAADVREVTSATAQGEVKP